MDRLDEVLQAARPLLTRVDDMLTVVGAPEDHAVWGELRRVRLLPADAVQAVAALRPSALSDAGPELRAEARACVEVAASLPSPDEWTGDAAEAYDEVRHRVTVTLSGADESLDERLQATAELAEALMKWMEQTRAAVAAALATVLTSGEALTLRSGPISVPSAGPEALAAADIAAHLLRTVADNYEQATDLIRGSTPLTTTALM
jgi:hypothetical protein